MAPSLHSFWSFSPLISSCILGTYQPGEFIFQCPIFLPFHTVHGVLKARILKWFAILFSSGPHFCQHSPPGPVCLRWPYIAWLSFIELDKAVVHVVILASFLWLWFQSVSPLKPFLSTYCLTLVLLPWMWGISSRLLQQSAATAPYLGCGVSPHGCRS